MPERVRLGVWGQKVIPLLEEAVLGSIVLQGNLFLEEDGEASFMSSDWIKLSPAYIRSQVVRSVGDYKDELKRTVAARRESGRDSAQVEKRLEKVVRLHQFMCGELKHSAVEDLVGKPLDPFMQAKVRALRQQKDEVVKRCTEEVGKLKNKRDLELARIDEELERIFTSEHSALSGLS